MNKIGFIGGGKMACAIIKGIINSGWCKENEIIVSAKSEETLNRLKSELGINTAKSNSEVVEKSSIIVFAVKPFILKDIMNEIKPYISKEKIFLSIAAGISINTMENILGEVSILRIMPNTPALVNEGMSAVCKGHYAKEEDLKCAGEIFKCIGQVTQTDEKFIDIITAISGSGPAFYYYIINEIAKSGEKLGLDYETCLKLSAQTALGSAKMILNSNKTPSALIKDVTTPGGCTEAGNIVLEESNISEILFDTIKKTKEKAFELGKN